MVVCRILSLFAHWLSAYVGRDAMAFEEGDKILASNND